MTQPLSSKHAARVGENQSFCVGYYSATVTATSAMWLLYEKPKLWCSPDNFTTEIGLKIWQRYVEEIQSC